MKSFKNVHLSIQFIGMISILFSLCSNSFGRFLFREDRTLNHENIDPPTIKEMWFHWNLGQTLKTMAERWPIISETGPDRVLRESIVEAYISSFDDLREALQETPHFPSIMSKTQEDTKQFFEDNPESKEAWVKVKDHYNAVVTAMRRISGGEEWFNIIKDSVKQGASNLRLNL
ncbi:uncharacterized protein MELLADRAFT_110433 [Melampsora larici-populina 98AG31]|uniref:Uncharacterized protein n=1 Tax=Melampsora larici-populina (strain 98AG31 / pathotype 3-4-7) TaxID=747676 RepID=F4RZT0_MELLP|nr:uncharacterized protein MELLADRAFT_110433 [Melampsora larici-populina 98AG31]EGG02058.1 hypothetical protein MELLADRAFT_110433 [Melampsora larici-populina 98AG31]